MAHFGLICPPGTSHVTAASTIARELCTRGHRATIFNILDVEDLAAREGMEFCPLGAKDHPKGSFKAFSDKFGKMKGLDALRYGIQVARAEVSMLLEEAPAAIRAAGVTALFVDQGQPAGSTIAERLGLPFVTICSAVPMDPAPGVPPSIVPWTYSTSVLGRSRSWLAHRLLDLGATPIRRKINEYRIAWGMRPLRSLYDTFSPILELAQESEEFDFPRRPLPTQFRYIGLIKRRPRPSLSFPFERLDGRPLVYGSLGTVLTDTSGLFRALAEVCAALDAQLVLTLGGNGQPGAHSNLPGSPIVVDYAPQMAVLERAALTVCHAGNNTVLESLSAGVPVIAVPTTTDQFGVAARVRATGAGDWITTKHIAGAELRDVIGRVLGDPSYARRAKEIGRSLDRLGGATRAADLIEERFGRASQ